MVERVRAIGVRRDDIKIIDKTFRPKHHHTRSGNNTTQTAVLISYMLISSLFLKYYYYTNPGDERFRVPAHQPGSVLGPVSGRSGHSGCGDAALENGATLDKVIAMAKKDDNGKGVKAPIVMFHEFQSDLPTGGTFVRQIADAGAGC